MVTFKISQNQKTEESLLQCTMAVLVSSTGGHIQNQLTRSLERILEEANLSGELKLSNRKLKDFPKSSEKYNLCDTVVAGE